jgi:hypothetical protein
MLRRFTNLFTAIVVVALIATGANAGPVNYDDAMTAYYKGDFATAAQMLRPLAGHGHGRAQRDLGRMYAKGEGVPKDEDEARKWFKIANEQAEAIKSYNQGDFETALRIFQPLAEKDSRSPSTFSD